MSGSPVNAMNFPNRRSPLRVKMKAKTPHSRSKYSRSRKVCKYGLAAVLFAGFLLAPSAEAQTQSPQTQLPQTQGPGRITLDEAIQLALQHNRNLLATTTTGATAQHPQKQLHQHPRNTTQKRQPAGAERKAPNHQQHAQREQQAAG